MGKIRCKARQLGLAAACFLVCILVLGPGTAAAYDVQVHGYGNQDFFMTNGNDYFGAEEGSWEHNSMSIVFTGNVTDDTAIWAKIFAVSEATTMEWLYVDHKIGDSVDARAGQMKLPLGIFNLIRDNKFLHLTQTEPALYTESIDIVHENFRGVGLEYHNDWFTIEAIAGAPELDEESESESGFSGPDLFTSELVETEARDLFGGRLKVKTPIEGLSLMVSASQFEEEIETTTEDTTISTGTSTVTFNRQEGDENLWIVSLDYEHHGLDVKAEYGRKTGLDEQAIAYYAEAGYTLFERLTPYVRYDYIATDIHNKGEIANHQKDTTVGLGFRVNDYVKVRVENHFIHGYALAISSGAVDPADLADLPERWNMFVGGVNFMF